MQMGMRSTLIGVGTGWRRNLLTTNGATLMTQRARILFYTNSVTPMFNDSFEYSVQKTAMRHKPGEGVDHHQQLPHRQTGANLTIGTTNVTAKLLWVPGYRYPLTGPTNLINGARDWGWCPSHTRHPPAAVNPDRDKFPGLGSRISALPLTVLPTACATTHKINF